MSSFFSKKEKAKLQYEFKGTNLTLMVYKMIEFQQKFIETKNQKSPALKVYLIVVINLVFASNFSQVALLIYGYSWG